MGKSGFLYILIVIICIAVWYGYFGRTSKFVSSSKNVNSAEQSFRNLPGLRGKKMNLFRDVSFYDDGRIYITVQDPDTLTHINAYQYQLHALRGEWDGPYPYKLDKSDYPLTDYLVPLDSCSFAAGAKIVTTYNSKAHSAGSNQTLDVIDYTMTAPHLWGWKVEDEINGGNQREGINYKILFNNDGSLKYFGSPDGWNALNERDELIRAQAALKNLKRFNNKSLKFYKAIEFEGGGIINISLLDPANPHHLLSYFCSAGSLDWDEDEDYEKSINKNLKLPAYLYPVDSVQFSTAAKIASVYAAKSKSVSSKKIAIDSLAFDVFTGHKPEWRFNDTIKSGNDNSIYTISFNTDGSLKNFVQVSKNK